MELFIYSSSHYHTLVLFHKEISHHHHHRWLLFIPILPHRNIRLIHHTYYIMRAEFYQQDILDA